MKSITNPKIDGIEPRWARFKGFSLLFDNPGDCLKAVGPVDFLRCDVHRDPALGFFRALAERVESFGVEALRDAYSFCPLPPHSYHVTAWDGGNQDNFHHFRDGDRSNVEELAVADGNAIVTANEVAVLIGASELVRRRDWNMRFRFGSLPKWDDSCLVVELLPTDEAAATTLLEIERLRAGLIDRFERKFGVRTCGRRYSPHVSLAYFANSDLADASTPHVEAWETKIAERLAGETLAFDTISLYGFTNMSNFYRITEP